MISCRFGENDMMSSKNLLDTVRSERSAYRTVLLTIGFVIVFTVSILMISYQISLKNGVDLYTKLYRVKSLMLLEDLTDSTGNATDSQVVATIEKRWRRIPNKPDDEYICIVDSNVNLVLHTMNPESVGNFAGANEVPEFEGNLEELYNRDTVYSGSYISAAGQKQIAVFRRVPGSALMLGVHRSSDSFHQEIKNNLRPLLIAIIAILIIILPISLRILLSVFDTIIRKRLSVEQQLEKREMMLSSVFTNMTNAFAYHRIVTDEKGEPVDFVILDVNPAFEMITGQKKEKILNRRISETLPDSGLVMNEWIPRYGKIALEGGSEQFEDYMEFAGKWFSIIAYSTEKGYFATMLEDITEKRRALMLLKENEERYNLAIYGSNEGIWDWNLVDNSLWLSYAWKSILGYRDEEIVNEFASWEKLTHPDDVKETWDIINKYVSGELPVFETEFRMMHKSGHWVDILSKGIKLMDDQGKAVRMVGTHQDITERKAAERSLKENEELLISITENIPNSYLIIINPDYSIAYSSGQEFFRKGMNPSDYNGKSVDELVGEEAQFLREQYRKTFSGEEQSFELSLSGQYHLYKTVPLPDWTGKISRILVIVENITEQKKAEDERRALQEQLLHSQKLEGIGQLAGGIAHDFNNILTATIGFTDLAKMYINKGNPRAADTLQQIESCNNRAVNLVRQLLAFSRKQTFSPKTVDINELIDQLNIMLKRMIGENIHIISPENRMPRLVDADPVQIEQIVTNLVINARDAINAKSDESTGQIEISTESLELTQDRNLDNMKIPAGQYIVIKVADNGSGMPDLVSEKIFTPFFTTKPVGEGTGLGLSTVYGIVKQNGGFIHLESELNVGTTFYIYWPASRQAEGPVKSESQFLEEGGHETILYVEDDEMIRELTHDYLTSQGYTVLLAENGRRALEFMEQSPQHVDLLVTDVIMPEMGGKELARIMRETNPETKILFVSGYNDVLTNMDGKLEADEELISKPYSLTEFSRVIRRVLNSGLV